MDQDDNKPGKPSDDAKKRDDLLEEEIFKALHGGYGRRAFGFSDSLKAIKQSMDDFHRRQEKMFSDSALSKVMRESRTLSDRLGKIDSDWRKRLGLDRIGRPLLPKSLLDAHKSILGSLAKPKLPESPWMKFFRDTENLRHASERLKPSEIKTERTSIAESLLGIAENLQKIRSTGIKLAPPQPLPPPEHLMRLEKAEGSARAAGTALEPQKGALTKSKTSEALAKIGTFVNDISDVARVTLTAEIEKKSGEMVLLRQEVRNETVEVRRGEVIDVSAAETPHEEDAQRGGGASPAQDDAEDLEVGKWAKKFVKNIDWTKRVITFKDRSRNKVIMPPKSDKAWEYMKRLLTTDDPEGWVELIGKDDANWTADFDRRDEYGCVDAKNPLTNLRCRIVPFRKRGRPKQDEFGEIKKENPKIRLSTFDKELFNSYTTTQKNTKKGRF